MLSPGVVSGEALQQFAAAGADWYACYQETHNRALFARLRLHQSFDERLQAKRLARRYGMLVEEGILKGVGETASRCRRLACEQWTASGRSRCG